MSGQAEGDKGQIWEKNKSSFNAKRTSEYYDPCQEAANRSMRCLKRNPDDRSLCQDFFDAYKDCKREWIHQMRSEPKSKSWLS